MDRSTLGRAAFSAAVALAIGFGAREALASPAAAPALPYCRDVIECERYCRATYPGTFEGPAECINRSCYCYI